jgi:uncharacterized protein
VSHTVALHLAIPALLLAAGLCEAGSARPPRPAVRKRISAPPTATTDLGQALVNAVQATDEARVKRLLSAGANPNTRDATGATPLMFAVFRGHQNIFETLLAAGARVDLKADSGTTALHSAASQGRLSMVRPLLDRNAPVEVLDGTASTPLMGAAEGGFLDVARLLLERGAKVNVSDQLGQTPLLVAIAPVFNLGLAQLRALDTFDPKEPPSDEQLQARVRERRYRMVELLLQNGANPNANDAAGDYAWDYALGTKDGALLELLKRHGAQEPTPDLLHGIRHNSPAEVTRALAAGADPNQRDEEATPVLVRAARGGIGGRVVDILSDRKTEEEKGLVRQEILRALLDHRADPDAQAKDGSTALTAALQTESPGPVYRLLVERGANPNKPGVAGLIPLHLAVMQGDLEAVQFLIEKGAHVDARDGSGFTATMKATNPAILDYLLQRGADPNARDSQGNTLLIARILGYGDGDPASMKVLIARGADVNAQAKPGWTALGVAADSNSPKALKALLTAGANPNLRDKTGTSPLLRAVDAQSLECVRALLAHKADCRAANKQGLTPLKVAIVHKDKRIISLLKAAGAR